MADNSDFKNIGAGWKKTSKAGNTYLSLVFDGEALKDLHLENMNVMVFPTKAKKTPNSPDYSISATEKRPQAGGQKPVSKPQPVAQARPAVKNYAPVRGDDEVPF